MANRERSTKIMSLIDIVKQTIEVERICCEGCAKKIGRELFYLCSDCKKETEREIAICIECRNMGKEFPVPFKRFDTES